MLCRTISTTLFLFSQIVLTILVPLPFCIYYRTILSITTKNLAGILIGIALNMHINLGSTDIFSILNLSCHRQGMSLHLCVSYLIFFHQCFVVFSMEVPHTFLLDFHISFKFILGIINGIVFLISVFIYSLLVYRNVTDFCVFTLYTATLLNSYILGVFCKFHFLPRHSSTDSDGSFLSFQTLYLIAFYFLIMLARTSSTILNKNGKRRHSYLFLDLRRKAVSLSSLM